MHGRRRAHCRRRRLPRQLHLLRGGLPSALAALEAGSEDLHNEGRVHGLQDGLAGHQEQGRAADIRVNRVHAQLRVDLVQHEVLDNLVFAKLSSLCA